MEVSLMQQNKINDGNNINTAKQEEWTTSRKVVNHKTKQVETRVQRQIIMEDGKVIADSGPQVTTKTKEDQKKEESENSNHKNIGDIDVPPSGYVAVPGGNVVVDEKTETHHSMREAKEENLHYHDESFKELSGLDIHRKALQAPNELISIDPENMPTSERPKGKLIHYSSKSNKINDTEEVKEVSRLGRDGTVVTETTRTQHHEEFDDDELPEKDVDMTALPESTGETTRKIEYLKDYDQGFDNFTNAMHNRKSDVRAIDGRSSYNKDTHISSEHDIRNTGTTRWLDDHFGSDESDIVETSNTRAGTNVINVEMPARSTTSSTRQSRNVSSTSQHKSSKPSQKYTTTATYYIKEPRSPSPRSSPEYYISRTNRDSRFREDASVQASLSDEDDIHVSEVRSASYALSSDNKLKQQRVIDRSNASTGKPEKSFYFGDHDIQHRNSKNERQDYFKQNINQQNARNLYHTIERDSKVSDSYHRNTELKNNENLWRESRDNAERSEIQHNISRFSDKQNTSISKEDSQQWISSSKEPVEYIHHPVIESDAYSIRRDPLTRQRNYATSISPPPQFSSSFTSKYNNNFSDNKEYKYSYGSSPSPPSPPLSPSGGTWTKSKGRLVSPLFRSTTPELDFPEFSPLQSPLEIKSVTDSFSNGRNYFSK